MLELYLWTTPNGRKPLILLEELGVAYEKRFVHLGKGEQKDDEYRKLNPNEKIPALVDRRGAVPVSVFESGAILVYLAETEGRFLPTEPAVRAQAMSWLMFQMASIGPIFGQLGHFMGRGEQAYARERFSTEAKRLLTVLDRRLDESEYLAGNDLTIADMATYPWVHNPAMLGVSPESLPQLTRWASSIARRPAVQRAMSVQPPA